MCLRNFHYRDVGRLKLPDDLLGGHLPHLDHAGHVGRGEEGTVLAAERRLPGGNSKG